jgi:hypothetical protein
MNKTAPAIIKNIQKTYKNHIEIIEYKTSWTPAQHNIDRNKNKTSTNVQKNLERNIIRAKTSIKDIVATNEFQYFVTLTISPETNINRYSYTETSKKVSKWVQNHLDRYILIPEKHKDGAFHFHLLADIETKKLVKHSKKVYNIKSYNLGFSTAIKITQNSTAKLSSYVTKYITKELISTVPAGSKRYWRSRNLQLPAIKYNVYTHGLTPVYDKNDIVIYNLPLKNSL